MTVHTLFDGKFKFVQHDGVLDFAKISLIIFYDAQGIKQQVTVSSN